MYVCPVLTSVLEGHCKCTTNQRALELEGDTSTISLFLLDCSSNLYLVPCTHQHCTVVCCAQNIIVSRSAMQAVFCLKWGLLVLQRVRSCITTVGVHNAASTCNLHKGMPLNYHPYPQFNGMPLCQLTVLAASCTPTVVMQLLTLCNLRWWASSSTVEHTYSLAHVVV